MVGGVGTMTICEYSVVSSSVFLMRKWYLCGVCGVPSLGGSYIITGRNKQQTVRHCEAMMKPAKHIKIQICMHQFD